MMGIKHFYPRSPCGERHILCVVSVQVGGFLSTLSLRRATQTAKADRKGKEISIHALLAESDTHNFPALHNIFISIHALLAESDDVIAVMTEAQSISIHALLAESDQ